MIRAVQLILETSWLGRAKVEAEVVMLPATGGGYTCSATVKVHGTSSSTNTDCHFLALPPDNMAQCLYNALRERPCPRYSNGRPVVQHTGWLAYFELMPYWITLNEPPEIVKSFSVIRQGTLNSVKQSTLNALL